MEYSTKVQKKWHKYMKMIFCCCFSLFISTTGLVAQIPTNGLIAWYPLNNNANDSSGNGYNGTVNATTPAADRFGNQGKAFTFNGVNSSITTGISLLNNLTGLTATGWINPTALGTRIGFFGQNDLFEFGFLERAALLGMDGGGGFGDFQIDRLWRHDAYRAAFEEFDGELHSFLEKPFGGADGGTGNGDLFERFHE